MCELVRQSEYSSLCPFEVWSSTWGRNHSGRMKKWMNRWIKPLLSFIICSNPSLAQNTHRDKHTLQLSHFQSQALWVLSHTLTLSVLFLTGRESKWFRTVWSFFNKLILTKAHANTCMCGCMCTLAVESWSVVVSTSQYFLSAIV